MASSSGHSRRRATRELGVSHGAPARHFRDKQALLDALALHGFQALDAAMREAAVSAGSIRGRFDAVAWAYVQFSPEHSELLQVMYTTKHHPNASVELQQTGKSGPEIVRVLLVETRSAGAIKHPDVDALTRVCFASVHGVASLAAGNLLGGTPVRSALAATLDVLWSGVAPRR